MTELTTLEKQKQILSQKKARLQKQTALLKVKERKLQLSHYIRIGELAEKAGIASLDLPTILGAFLSISDHINDISSRNLWKQRGEQIKKSIMEKK